MKTQIKRLSPHQNGKVFGVMMALGSLIFVLPMAAIVAFFPTPTNAAGQSLMPAAWIYLCVPIIYLIMGYLMTAAGCFFYNVAYRYIGGIEFETVAVGGEAD